jgi:YD repeat-containing protein
VFENIYDSAQDIVLKGQIKEKIDPYNHTTLYSRDKVGNIIKKVDKNNNQTSYISATGLTKTTQYDEYNKPTKIMQNNKEKNYSYDNLGRIVQHSDFKGNISSYTYDERNNKISETAALNTPEESITSFLYDDNSNLIRVKTANILDDSDAIYYEYNELNQRVKEITAQNRITSYTYDSLGNMASYTKPDTTKIDFTYDTQNRQTQTHVDGEIEEEYTYDNLSRLKTAQSHNQGVKTNSLAYSYNAFSQITSEKQNDKEVTTTYDEALNPISISYNKDFEVTQSYDLSNNLKHLRYNTYDIVEYSHNEDNLLIQEELYNGIDVSIDYDKSARVINKDYKDTFKEEIAYDKNSNIIQEKITLNNETLLKVIAMMPKTKSPMILQITTTSNMT